VGGGSAVDADQQPTAVPSGDLDDRLGQHLEVVGGGVRPVITIAGATAEGAHANPLVSKAVASATVGPFLVGAMGLAASLTAAGVLILLSGLFTRWIAIVALVGGLAFFVTFLTLIAGPGADSIFGYGFFPGFLSLTTWSIAASIASHRTLATSAREFPLVRPSSPVAG
jgi:hypothetical protein